MNIYNRCLVVLYVPNELIVIMNARLSASNYKIMNIYNRCLVVLYVPNHCDFMARALRTDLHSAVLLEGEDGNKAGNKEHLKRLYNICH